MSTPTHESKAELVEAIGDATQVSNAYVVHICSDERVYGSGFVVAVTKAFGNEPRNTHLRRRTYELGDVDFIEVKDGVTVCNMIAQHGLKSWRNPKPVDYVKLKEALAKVADHILESKKARVVHMPRIGCDRGGGKWSEVRPLIEETLIAADIHVTVWTLPRSAPCGE